MKQKKNEDGALNASGQLSKWEDDQDETTIDVSQPNGEVEITNTMGYVSSVEDARNKFEELFKINQGPKEN